MSRTNQRRILAFCQWRIQRTPPRPILTGRILEPGENLAQKYILSAPPSALTALRPYVLTSSPTPVAPISKILASPLPSLAPV